MSITLVCPDCDGAGYVTHNPSVERYGYPGDPQCEVDVRCGACRGAGEVDRDETPIRCIVRCAECEAVGEREVFEGEALSDCVFCGSREVERP